MKQITHLLIFLVSIISACKTDTQKETFPIDIVLKNSFKQQDKLNLGDRLNLEKYKPIDTTFLKKWFQGMSIPELDNKKLEYDHFSQWYFIDHRIIDDKIIFSILNSDEVGFVDLYYLSYDTLNKKILDINYLTQSGGDGGYYKEDLIEWQDKNSIRIICNEYNEEDLTDSTTLSKSDSSVYIYSYADRPFKAKVIFKYSKTDTIIGK